MTTRIKSSQKLKQGYTTASKTKKGHILDRFCEATGLSRSSARRYLTSDTLRQPQSCSYRPTQSKTTQVQSDSTKNF